MVNMKRMQLKIAEIVANTINTPTDKPTADGTDK